MKLLLGALIAAACCLTAGGGVAWGEPEPVSFEREVLPLLEARCNDCHHPEETRGGLDLTRLSTMMRGGDELGATILPGKPAESPLIQVLTGELEPAMPDKAEPLPQVEIDLLRRWITEGAHDDTPDFSAEDIAFFEREVRPVLFEHCFKCHAGEDPESGLLLSSRWGILRGGERGPAAVPGDPDASRILAAVRHEGELKMPRGGDPLDDKQIAALKTWIERGLPWPKEEGVLTREKLFTISEADRNHWAFRPLPEALPADWSVDDALQKRHAEAGLKAAPQSEKHALLRRLSFDVIGYPPTPEEIEAFVSDASPDAYDKAVDRLLDSPLYGWRWGRHWLDYTRTGANGQSNRGPEMDTERYIDWVMTCFNEDRPYDWFVRAHLAGDRMPAYEGGAYSINQAIAAAVPLNGARTFQNAATETFTLMDKLDEGVEFMGRSLLGISLECARCHDHKFDPISQRDYYALLGFFQSSWFGAVPRDAQTQAEADARVKLRRELEEESGLLFGRLRKEAAKVSIQGGELRKTWKEDRQTPLAPVEKRMVELEVEILKAELRDAMAQSGVSDRFLSDLRDTISDREARVANFQPRYFYVVAFKEMGYEIYGHKSQVGLIERATEVGLEEVITELREIGEFWREERELWDEVHRFGGYRKTAPEVAELAALDDRIVEIRRTLRAFEEDQIIVRCEGGLRRAEELEPFKRQASAEDRQFYVETVPAYIGDSVLLRRGDVLEPDRHIPRGYPEFFGGETPELEGSGRMELAQWITESGSLQEALVARAMVNRAWQNLFGEALCRTPKELGRLGEDPELPEVIDGLAARFIESGWSTKALLREILLSQAYRQSSLGSEAGQELDPENRWFARQNVRRLGAEPIMQAMSYLSQNKRTLGPINTRGVLPGKADFAENFDAPTTDDLIDRRVASIAPSQALFLMNDRDATGVISQRIQSQLSDNGEEGLLANLDALYLFVLNRPPTDADREFATGFVERRRAATGEDLEAECREFIHLLLCSNELIYLE